jgi:hypothetical protein
MHWDTILPTFTRMEIKKGADGFTVAFTANCKNDPIDYTFSGQIEGTADGKITFHALGQSNSNFKSPRIGLCVLYGSGSLVEQDFEVTDANGKTIPLKFPRDISRGLVADSHQSLRYTTSDGMTVACSLQGGTFEMEDQRQFGDSSFKAYGPIPYAYPDIIEGGKGDQTLVVQVSGAKPQPLPQGPVQVTVGEALQGAKIPRLIGSEEKPPQGVVVMNYSPALHLFDEDSLMENPPVLAELVRLRKDRAKAAPDAKVVIFPATIEAPWPRPVRDPRNTGVVAAAWSALFMKYAAAAGVDAVKFDVGPGSATIVQNELGALAGCQVLDAKVQAVEPTPVDALAIESKGQTIVYLINKTDRPQQAAVAGVKVKVEIWRLNENLPAGGPAAQDPVDNGALRLELKPFEVARIAGPAK